MKPPTLSVLPIIARELLVRSRQPATWRVRLLAAALALVVAGLMLLTQKSFRPPTALGHELFVALTILTFICCLIEGARQSSDSLSEERREGTLGLLFLTDLTGRDVVLGKLAAASLHSFYSLLAIVPIFALTLLYGGVSGGEFFRVTLVLLNTLFFAHAASMWVSARSHDEQRALFGALGLLAVLAGGLELAGLVCGEFLGTWSPLRLLLLLPSPSYACQLAFDQNFVGNAKWFWASLALTHLLGWMFLWRAGHLISPGRGEEIVLPSRPRFGLRGSGSTHPTDRVNAELRTFTPRPANRRALLEINPMLWLASRSRGLNRWVWVCAGVALAAAVWPMFRPYFITGFRMSWQWNFTHYFQFAASVGLRLLVVALACRCFVEARRTGALELWLTTPLQVEEILRGQWLALRRVLLWPVLLLIAGQLLGFRLRNFPMFAPGSTPGWHLDQVLITVVFLFNLLVTPVLEVFALGWVGMWLGLSARKPAHAILLTALYVLVLPWLVTSVLPRFLFGGNWVLLTTGAAILPMMKDVIFIYWARGKLRGQFRVTAARQNS